MKWPWLLLAVIPSAVGAAQESGLRYDCSLDRRVILASAGAQWTQSLDAIPSSEAKQWSFSIQTTGAGTQASVSYERDVMRLAGTHDIMWLAPGQFAFASAHPGPCLFTEKGCMALVEVSDLDDDKALVSVTPSGSALIKETGKRQVFQVISLGSCRRSKVPTP